VLFPNILAVGSGGGNLWKFHFYQIRVPMDDEHTMHYWYYALVPPPWATVPEKLLREIPAYDMPYTDERGEYLLDFIDGQDIMAWETQGAIADRRRETLGARDRGVTMWRRILRRELKKLEAGEDPMCVLRDPARNAIIELHVEKGKTAFKDGFASLLRRMPLRYAPIADDLLAVFAPRAPAVEAAKH